MLLTRLKDQQQRLIYVQSAIKYGWSLKCWTFILTIADRFGQPVKPREWFLVPLQVIDEAVRQIREGSIADVVYDPQTARLVAPA